MNDNFAYKAKNESLQRINESELHAVQTVKNEISNIGRDNYEQNPDSFHYVGDAGNRLVDRYIYNQHNQILDLRDDRKLLKEERKKEEDDYKKLTKEVKDKKKLDNKRAKQKYKKEKGKLKKEVKKGGLSKKEIKERTKRLKYENRERRSRQQGNEFYTRKRGEIKQKEENIKDINKDINKNRGEALKKQSAVTALKSGRAMMNDIKSGSGLSSDDLLAAGNSSLAGKFLRFINPLARLKDFVVRQLMALIGALMSKIASVLLPFIIVFMLLGAIAIGVAGLASGLLNVLGLGASSSAPNETTNQVITDVDAKIAERGDITPEQKALLEYAFSKVGCDYTTKEEVENNVSRIGPDSFDCSGFAYKAEEAGGKSIGAGRACNQAESLYKAGKNLKSTSDQLQIGDLIFYGNIKKCQNPRDTDKAKHDFMYIYHVAVYVGNGYVIHASCEEVGVIYSRVSSGSDVVLICRP